MPGTDEQETSVKLGALLNPLPAGSAPDALATLATALANTGYDSLWTPQAIGRGLMMTDPFVTLTVAATVTRSVEIGAAVMQLPLYHPMEFAHRVFSLMQLCGDRLTLGVGVGSTDKDFDAFDRPYTSRFRDFETRLSELRTIFETGRLGDSDLTPWPEVLGGPRIFLGTWGKGVERAATEFDGWIASAHYRTPDEVCDALVRYRNAGGQRALVSTIVLSGNTDMGELSERLARFSDAGFDDAVVMFAPGAPEPAAVRALVT